MINLLLHHHHHHPARLPRNTVSGVVVAQAWERARTDARTHSSTLTILPALSCFSRSRPHNVKSDIEIQGILHEQQQHHQQAEAERPWRLQETSHQPLGESAKGCRRSIGSSAPRHDVTMFTSTVNQTHMMPPDCLECTSTCRFKKKGLSFHACNHPIRRRRKKKKESICHCTA